MNTDNTSISAETIDYGPCAFMEAYDPQTVFSSIDRQGRYSYGNQPGITLWNLTRLAETLLPLLEQEDGSREAAIASAQESLEGFAPQYESARLAGLRRKLGFAVEREGDLRLAEDLLERMAVSRADFTLTFRSLSDAAAGLNGDLGVRAQFADGAAYDTWTLNWRRRLEEESVSAEERAASMRRVNPAYIPRNHMVASVLHAAIERQDFAPFEELLNAVTRPYEERSGLERYANPARPEERVLETFCGT